MAAKWLVARWAILFPALEQAETETQVKALCEAEIQAWRERPEIKSESTLRNPMMLSRKEIEKRLSGDRQLWALRHLAFSREWYILHNTPSKNKLAERLTHQQFIKDPDAVVAKATELLTSNQWPDVVVGLGVCTGRRIGEVLQTGKFEHKTAYSVMFSGVLKRQEEVEFPAFEIPTLCTAQQAIDAVARLRVLLPLDGQDIGDITRKYSPLAQEAANRHFLPLLPLREGKTSLYTHLFRTIYARIALFWYAPPSVADTHYMATVCGHYEAWEAETEELRQAYASNLHYSDYKIADAQGNIDGRQGVRLGMKGVELLEIYKPKPRKEKAMSTDTQTQEPTKPEGKNVPVTVDRPTFNRVQALRSTRTQRTYSETLNLLLDSYEQGGQAPMSTGELTPDRVVPAGTMIQLSADQSVPAVDMIRQTLEDGEDFRTFLIKALTKEAKFRAGLDRRHEGKDFSSLTLAQLSKTRDPRATNERIRRAILAIAAYNDDPARAATERWFLNATTVHRLVGGRYPIIGAYLKDHQSEIDAANNKYQLNDRYNNKPYYVDTVVSVPDEPPTATEQEPETAEATE